MNEMGYHAIVEKSEDGGFWASVRELPGCYSEGDTMEELRENIREAILLHLEGLEDEPIPDGASVMSVSV